MDFLALPAEIREIIYYYCLVSDRPIDIGRERRDEGQDYESDYHNQGLVKKTFFKLFYYGTDYLATSILFCNKQIYQEAISVFYKENIFRIAHFYDDEESLRAWDQEKAAWQEEIWQAAIYWLTIVGPQNRSKLSTLVIRFVMPTYIHQESDGSRYDDCYRIKKGRPRSPYLGLPENPIPGYVEDISPKIEQFFKLIGRRESHKLTIIVALDDDYLPGNRMRPYLELKGTNDLLGMDVPNLMEKFRTMYNCSRETPNRIVDIIWNGEAISSFFESRRGFLEEIGWEIVNTVRGQRGFSNWASNCRRYMATTRFTLRRKPLSGPLIAEHPFDRCSNSHRFDIETDSDNSEDEGDPITFWGY